MLGYKACIKSVIIWIRQVWVKMVGELICKAKIGGAQDSNRTGERTLGYDGDGWWMVICHVAK